MERVFLIGQRGCGKTTVGRLLAARLGWDSLDTDDEVERSAGKTIVAIFADEGEEAFRDLEEHAVAAACERPRVVISLGGGSLGREASRARVTAAGPVVWLTATPETLASRLAADKTSATRRPPLTDKAGVAEVELLLAARAPIYRGCATLMVDSEAGPPEAVADAIASLLNPL